jgi:hypothetical protein
MLSYSTAAAAPSNVANAEQPQTVLLGPGVSGNTSAQFTVDQQPFFVSAFGLGSSDNVTIYQVFGTGAGQEVGGFAPVYQPVTLNQNRSKCRIDYPGRYYVVHTGPTPTTEFSVTGFAMTMTHENVSELAYALYSAFENIHPADVVGTAPIIVTGNGTPGTPYDVSLSTTPGSAPANFVEVEGTSPIVVTGNGTAATPYDIALSSTAGSAPPNFVEVTATFPITITGNGTAATPYDLGISGVVLGGEVTTVGSGIPTTGLTRVSLFGNSAGAGDVGVTDCVGIGNFALTSAGSGSCTFNSTVAVGAATFEQTGGVVTISYGTAVGFEAALGCGVTGTFFGCKAGYGNGYTNCIVINNPSGNALAATQNNQAVLGDSTVTQLVTAGSIIQAGTISASDKRLKKNVAMESDALELVNNLEPVTFNWDRYAVQKSKVPMNETEFGKLQHGLIAQDVENYLPEVIETIDRGAGEYKFVHYDRLIPILIAAIKELSQKVTDLENGNV